MARAIINVCGTDVRQTYLHDAFYGMATLYRVLGKPYLGSTEGNESAHQIMKAYFKGMTSHSNKRIGDALQTLNLMHLHGVAIDRHGQFAAPTAESERRGCGDMGRQPGKRARKNNDDAILASDAHLQAISEGKTGDSVQLHRKKD